MKLDDLKSGAAVQGILPDQIVTVIHVKWHGPDAVELTYKDSAGRPGCELLYREREPGLNLVQTMGAWRFDGDGELFRLASEARRIRLAHLFDPMLAVHTSLIDPLPHQITAVYGDMLARQPLRFLLADDPGAGKTIMTGLLLKELLARGDLSRCLIVCPGSLSEQWQDELDQKFHLPFDVLSRRCWRRPAAAVPLSSIPCSFAGWISSAAAMRPRPCSRPAIMSRQPFAAGPGADAQPLRAHHV